MRGPVRGGRGGTTCSFLMLLARTWTVEENMFFDFATLSATVRAEMLFQNASDPNSIPSLTSPQFPKPRRIPLYS